MDEKIKNGAFQIARQLFDSELWIEKPSSWKIIWIYILGKVNHQDNKQFERGEGFFNFTQELKQIGRDITYDMIRHSMTYFKRNGMLSTTKSTRGIIVKVLKYNKFQKLENYKSTTASTTKAQPKHNESTTINKNVKNANNVKNVSTKEIDKEKYPFLKDKDFTKAFKDYLDMRKVKATQNAIELRLKDLHKYDIKTAITMIENSIMNGYQGIFPLKNKPSNNKGDNYGKIKQHSEPYPEGTPFK